MFANSWSMIILSLTLPLLVIGGSWDYEDCLKHEFGHCVKKFSNVQNYSTRAVNVNQCFKNLTLFLMMQKAK
ncbi:hypothetical protein BD770DRAFT_446989 [Pilaira anomala]|nr:hypothetical protein BD770DRAFT_446989 [Pilaira anomala]